MLDTVLLCVVLGVPSVIALFAIDRLDSFGQAYRSHRHLQCAVGMFADSPSRVSGRLDSVDAGKPSNSGDLVGSFRGGPWRSAEHLQGAMSHAPFDESHGSLDKVTVG